ncbi:malate synthase G [Arsenicitalea aurantiaca]|uniref:Malate synthase G n=1 Tax=Arsenicitalea aurantiaca TaxID=1783274 RepID=A0A433XLN9_9HYPH|nr:malate synthase G [Arsenicitalea aurantiaca]RUT34934.1 malate synthase G [Arsenicitalea aurantiaca]
MPNYLDKRGLKVDAALAAFVETEALAGTGVSAEDFWSGLESLVSRFSQRNRELLKIRDRLQSEIDDWHRSHGPATADLAGYEQFLRDIGYLVEEPGEFTIETEGLDPEISSLCGPQLVVPVSNARYALNAANARWGSLYDALYGTDAVSRDGDLAPGRGFNAARGAAVVARAAEFLDDSFPLAKGSHRDVTAYTVLDTAGVAALVLDTTAGPTTLADKTQFAGYREDGGRAGILLVHNGLHAELVLDRENPIGAHHPAGLADIVLESALTTIQDCEDSVAAVDAEDKIGVYRNWLGLMTGSLVERFEKGGKTVERRLNPDLTFTAPDGKPLVLKGRALLLVRNVGHLMTTRAVLDAEDRPIGEGLLDAAITVLCAKSDRTNSRTGAIYVVKPKMHGPDEVAFACEIFGAVEEMLGLKPNTVKIGIMDEERRTSANLKAAIHAARERVFFINTGFLDRTGDEIHTAMEAGPVLRKDDIKSERWISAYEDRNVLIGLACGFSGRAQIGKGMWARPDDMAEMLKQKIGHPRSGANCAWVPSPTAATLHALHYHAVNVFEAQKRRHNEPTPGLETLFSMPVLDATTLAHDQIVRELENNAQGILGYVVRWVQQGVGCSKVPDLNNVALMEDRATCRISSQAVANWLRHGLVSKEEVTDTFERMASVVDQQNAGDPLYRPMAGNFQSVAFQAALDLALHGADQPSGYTEPILHARREKVKARDAV